jgi:hypothetical protein
MFDAVEASNELQGVSDTAVHIRKRHQPSACMRPTTYLHGGGRLTVEETVEDARGIGLYVSGSALEELPRSRCPLPRGGVTEHHVPVVAHVAPHRAALDVLRALWVEHHQSGRISFHDKSLHNPFGQTLRKRFQKLRHLAHPLGHRGDRNRGSASQVDAMEPVQRNVVHVLAHHHVRQ